MNPQYDDKQEIIQLYCLPYAGAGGDSVYRGWQSAFGNRVKICPLTPPGREKRFEESLVDDMETVIEDLYSKVTLKLQEPFAIFGHSMGGMLAYELARKIKQERGLIPHLMFLSATRLAADNTDVIRSNLSDEDLIVHLCTTDGVDKRLLASDNFKRYFFPVIRNDYRMLENYHCCMEKLSCPVRIFATKEDKVIPCFLSEQISELADDYTITYFKGGHFFINTQKDAVIAAVKKEIDLIL